MDDVIVRENHAGRTGNIESIDPGSVGHAVVECNAA